MLLLLRPQHFHSPPFNTVEFNMFNAFGYRRFNIVQQSCVQHFEYIESAYSSTVPQSSKGAWLAPSLSETEISTTGSTIHLNNAILTRELDRFKPTESKYIQTWFRVTRHKHIVLSCLKSFKILGEVWIKSPCWYSYPMHECILGTNPLIFFSLWSPRLSHQHSTVSLSRSLAINKCPPDSLNPGVEYKGTYSGTPGVRGNYPGKGSQCKRKYISFSLEQKMLSIIDRRPW